MTLYWYVKLDGKVLPTPYLTYEEAIKACNELEERLIAPILEVVLQ